MTVVYDLDGFKISILFEKDSPVIEITTPGRSLISDRAIYSFKVNEDDPDALFVLVEERLIDYADYKYDWNSIEPDDAFTTMKLGALLSEGALNYLKSRNVLSNLSQLSQSEVKEYREVRNYTGTPSEEKNQRQKDFPEIARRILVRLNIGENKK